MSYKIKYSNKILMSCKLCDKDKLEMPCINDDGKETKCLKEYFENPYDKISEILKYSSNCKEIIELCGKSGLGSKLCSNLDYSSLNNQLIGDDKIPENQNYDSSFWKTVIRENKLRNLVKHSAKDNDQNLEEHYLPTMCQINNREVNNRDNEQRQKDCKSYYWNCYYHSKIGKLILLNYGNNFEIPNNKFLFIKGSLYSSICVGIDIEKKLHIMGSGVGNTSAFQSTFNVEHKYKSVDIGFRHVVAITEEGKIVQYAHREENNLYNVDVNLHISDSQLINENAVIDTISCGYDFNGAIDLDGNLYMWGSNCYNQRNRSGLPIETKFKKIICSKFNSVALTKDNKLYYIGVKDFSHLKAATDMISYIISDLAERITYEIDHDTFFKIEDFYNLIFNTEGILENQETFVEILLNYIQTCENDQFTILEDNLENFRNISLPNIYEELLEHRNLENNLDNNIFDDQINNFIDFDYHMGSGVGIDNNGKLVAFGNHIVLNSTSTGIDEFDSLNFKKVKINCREIEFTGIDEVSNSISVAAIDINNVCYYFILTKQGDILTETRLSGMLEDVSDIFVNEIFILALKTNGTLMNLVTDGLPIIVNGQYTNKFKSFTAVYGPYSPYIIGIYRFPPNKLSESKLNINFNNTESKTVQEIVKMHNNLLPKAIPPPKLIT